MYILTAEASFDSAHFLAGYNGKCRNIHGHRWLIKVEAAGSELQQAGQMRDRKKYAERADLCRFAGRGL